MKGNTKDFIGSGLRNFSRFLYMIFHEELMTLLATTVGTALACFAVVALIMPYKFASGGVTGIALITNYMWGFSPAWGITIGNILLLLWGWKYLSRRFALWTLYVTILTSVFVAVFEMFTYPVIPDKILAALLGGVVGGVGFGMMFQVDASSGGMDVIVMAARRRWGTDAGKMSFYVNIIILLGSFVTVSLDEILYGALLLYVETLTLDKVMHSFDQRTQILVISEHRDEIKNFILDELERSATLIQSRGAYLGMQQEMLLVVLPRRQVPMLKRHIASLDPLAFVIFSDVTEVLGEGFKSWKKV